MIPYAFDNDQPMTYAETHHGPVGESPEASERLLFNSDHGKRNADDRAPEPVDVIANELLQIWLEVLPGKKIKITDGFFSVGGSADQLRSVLQKIETVYGRKLSLDMFLRDPTVRGVAKLIRSQCTTQFSSVERIQPNGHQRALFAIPSCASPRLVFAGLSKRLGIDRPFYGLKPYLPDQVIAPSLWYKTTASLYVEEILRIQPDGPYHLLGRCWGGLTAYEVAQQLLARDKDVGMLALYDCGPAPVKTLRFHARSMNIRWKMFWTNLQRRWQGRFPIEHVMIPGHSVHFDLVYEHRRPEARYDQLVWDANLRGASNYRCDPYDGKVTLLQSEQFARLRPSEVKSWSRLCDGNLTHHVLPGRHEEGLHGVACEELALVLQSTMNP